MLNPESVFYRHLRIQDHLAELPVAEAESAQLSSGSSDLVSVVACGRDLMIGRARMEPNFVSNVVLEPGWVMLMIPLGWQGDYIFNGQLAHSSDVFVSSSRDGYVARGSKRDNLGLGVRISRLKTALRRLSGRSYDNFPLHDQRLTLNCETSSVVKQQSLAAIDIALKKTLPGGRGLLPKIIEDEIFYIIADIFLTYTDATAEVIPVRIDPLQIVRKARSVYEDRPAHLVTLEDLCSAAGVGQRWLHKCFAEIYGVSPMYYHRMRRLRAARDRLQDPVSPPQSIKDVALSLGFLNGGRFAAEYRALFGETPSDTLVPRNWRTDLMSES